MTLFGDRLRCAADHRPLRVWRFIGLALSFCCLAAVVARCGSTVRDTVQRGDVRSFPGGGTLTLIHGEPLLVPYGVAGWVGWCMVTNGENGCAALRPMSKRARLPIVAEAWGGGEPPPVTEAAVITKPSVHNVVVEGVVVPTQRDEALPERLRGVAVKIRGRVLINQVPFPRFAAVNVTRSPSALKGAVASGLAVELPTASWNHGESEPSSGVCQLRTMRLASVGLMLRGQVVTRLEAKPNIAVPNAFTTCLSVQYTFKEFPLSVGAFVRGGGVAASTLPSLPGMRPVPGYPGTYTAPGEHGTMVVRRSGPAWLYVFDDSASLRQRENVLHELRVHVRSAFEAGSPKRDRR